MRVSRRCSRGRSTVPSGITSPPWERQCGGDQPELGVLGEVGHQLVEGVGHVERRQPDLVGRRPLPDHVVDRHVEEAALLALRGGRPASTSGSGSTDSMACTSAIVKGRMPCTWPPSSRRTRGRVVAGGPET